VLNLAGCTSGNVGRRTSRVIKSSPCRMPPVRHWQFSTSTVKATLLMMPGWEYLANPLDSPLVSGFLAQLAQAAASADESLESIIPRNFQFDRVRSVAILLDHHQRRSASGDHIHPVNAINDIEIMRCCVRAKSPVGRIVKILKSPTLRLILFQLEIDCSSAGFPHFTRSAGTILMLSTPYV